MSEQNLRLIERAKSRFGDIYPCVGKAGWDESFTRYNGQVIFWFNTRDNSTHVETDGQ